MEIDEIYPVGDGDENQFIELVDTGRVCAWIRSTDRRRANLSFTEGPERQIAYAVEDLLTRYGIDLNKEHGGN